MATVTSLVTNASVEESDYSICLNPDCSTVYFGPESIFDTNDIAVKVWFKEKSSPVPICYCKDVTDDEIIRHVAVDKCCSSLAEIQKHTGANTGKECLVKNPTGK